ncbi:MAG TPA: serpin family protein, partial [Actinomycetales bacterium]|nr:serpin family protein [Actinomycetales bacterium]
MSRSRPVAALAALAGLALGALAACGGSPAAAAQELRGTASFAPQPLDAEAARAVIVASERMGREMLVSADPGENAVVSPASLTLAFAMLAPGASGPGVSELTELLGTDPATAAVVAGGLLDHFSTWDGDVADFDPTTLPDEPFLHIANRAVVREGFEAEADYLDALAENFNAGLALADFADAAGAKELLDEWVDHHTAGLIPESAIEPTPDLVLVLQNAVLFGAQWESQFEQHLTYERDFTPVDGAAFRVPMMSNPHAAARY